MNEKMEKYIAEELQATPTTKCDFKVGDVVTYTNDFGVSFEGNKVIGFSKPDHPLLKYEKFIHLDNDCYWMPVSIKSLSSEPVTAISKRFSLNNCMSAVHCGFNFWGDPLYMLENRMKACMLDGVLYSVTNEDEAVSPLEFEFQAF